MLVVELNFDRKLDVVWEQISYILKLTDILLSNEIRLGNAAFGLYLTFCGR